MRVMGRKLVTIDKSLPFFGNGYDAETPPILWNVVVFNQLAEDP